MKPVDLKNKLTRGEPVRLLDVREPEEVAVSAGISGAEPMPMGKVFLEAARGHFSKTEKMVAICAKGGRCEIVARELKKDGYDIEHLEGGIEAWHKLSA